MILLICPPVGLDMYAQVIWSQLSRCHVAYFPLSLPSSSQTLLLSALRCARGLFLVRSTQSQKSLILWSVTLGIAGSLAVVLLCSKSSPYLSLRFSLVKLQECKFTFSLSQNLKLWKGQSARHVWLARRLTVAQPQDSFEAESLNKVAIPIIIWSRELW